MRLLLTISIIYTALSVFGQTLDATISKNRAKIGEPLIVEYKVKTDQKDIIVFHEKYTEIPLRTYNGGQLSNEGTKAEIIKKFEDSSTRIQGGQLWRGTYTVMIWDSGSFSIPGPDIFINDSTFTFDDIRIYCDLSEKQSDVDLYDIRENYAELPEKENAFLFWIKQNGWLLLVIAVALITLLWFIKRRKPSEPEEITKAMSLKDRTLAAIDALEKERLWEQKKLKNHFVELSYILRSYLTARYDLSLLEKTTVQTKQLLIQKGLNEDTVATIVRILSQSDMVKFAQSELDEIAILKISTLARQIVAETSPLEFDNYE